MLSSFVYQTDKPVVRLLQITDPHLFKDTNKDLLGINTQASFAQVLTEIQASDFDYELILATGDLVQDSSDEGYRLFVEMTSGLDKPLFWIPGNHDFQPKMVEFLNHHPINRLKHLLIGDNWQILLLDSQVSGVPHGELSQYQLDWIGAKLAQNPSRFSLIVLHHHLLPTNSAWLDQHNLRNSQDLLDVLSPFKNVKAIMYGHIHQAVDDMWFDYRVMATPSTCIQFKPDSNHFSLDALQPGWREIELYNDGHIETRVKRIQDAVFLPNMREDGYE